MLIVATLPSTLIHYLEPCSFDSGRTGFVWVRRVWNGSADPKSRQIPGAFRHTISQRTEFTFCVENSYDGTHLVFGWLWIVAAISNTSRSNKAGSTTVKQARITRKRSRSTAVLSQYALKISLSAYTWCIFTFRTCRVQALQHADQTGDQSFVHLSSEYTDYRKNHQPLTLWRILCLFRICNLFSFFMRKLLSFGICLSACLECLPPSFTSEFECFTARFIFQLSPSMQYTK